MAVLEPEMAILDETDSGLDIDALRIVAEGVNAQLNPNLGVLLITHYQRLLNYITPDVVHVLAQGRIVKSGGKDLALRLEEEGYGPILREAGLSPDLPDEALQVPRTRSASSSRSRPPARRASTMTLTSDPRSTGRRLARPARRRARLPDPRRRSSTATRWSTSTRASTQPEAARRASTRSTTTTASTTPTSIAASTRSARRRPPPTRRRGRTVARFINAPDSHEIIFTRNATEAINLVAYSWGRRNIGRGDPIVLTEMEHHSNLVPWQLLVQEKDGDLEFIPITDDGILRLDVFEVLLRLKPKLVAFTHVSNTLGTINPVREMVEMAHAAGALVLVDGAQAVPHVPVDVQALGADFYAFTGHKMLGPTGSGALWARRELLEAMPPFLGGGEMIREVHLRRTDVQRDPLEVRGGHAGRRRRDRAGRGRRVPAGARHGRTSASTSASSSRTRSSCCRARCPASRSTARSTRTCAAASSRSTCRASTRTTWPRSSTASAIAVRAGHHCTSRSTSASDLAATARASFNVYSTREDIDAPGRRACARSQRVFNV